MLKVSCPIFLCVLLVCACAPKKYQIPSSAYDVYTGEEVGERGGCLNEER